GARDHESPGNVAPRAVEAKIVDDNLGNRQRREPKPAGPAGSEAPGNEAPRTVAPKAVDDDFGNR
ncbi:MAG: hypothetical protein GZ089_10910, partial [Aromatoleum sp.]|nr:hypothetical protein [Aromatoleum sp.]